MSGERWQEALPGTIVLCNRTSTSIPEYPCKGLPAVIDSILIPRLEWL